MTSDRKRRILVVANRTCPCPTLADEVARRASAAPTEVLVVAPALNACASGSPTSTRPTRS